MGKQITGLVQGRNNQTGWELQNLLTGPHNLLSNKPFVNLPPISCCSINCRVLLRGRQQAAAGFSSDPARATTASQQAHHVASESSFLRDLPKDRFQFWLLYFRQSTYTHPWLDASLHTCLFIFLRFCSGKFSLTSVLWYIVLRELLTNALSCAKAE